ncbi:MAG: hypothetical protein K0S65_2453 [Labilithrix sp.]|nr:hypothetical protein [Labilithrix sp.]
MSASRRLLQLASASLSLAGLLAVTDASADVQACLSASEKGQRARSAGKLREARDQFVICGAEGCPGIVRHDCAQWNSELAQTLPSVVFGARDNQGRDLFDVTVTVDGEPLVKKLDGKSVTVDPGKHTFRFETQGFPAVTQVALIKEGERARVFNITFDGGTTTPITATPSPSTTPPVVGGESGITPASGHSPYPWILVGVGGAAIVAGVVIAVTAPERPSNCNEDTEKCTQLEGQSSADFAKDKEQAGKADSQPALGYAVAIGGTAVVIGGLVWHFLEPVGGNKGTGFRLAPWTTGQSSGIALGGRF